MPAARTDETSLVVAARAGDRRAVDELVAAYLPVVYTIVRRALGGHPDADDVVQETMLRALRELPLLRSPDSFRAWLAAIAVRQVATHLRRRRAAAGRLTGLDEAVGEPDEGAGVEGPAALRAELSDQRRQVVRASRWLDGGDRALLSLWWLETAGRLTRAELAAAMGMSVAHAAVRVQRMRGQLDASRSVVAALEATPPCARLRPVAAGWDGTPGPLWRKRFARHVRSCPACTRAGGGLVAPERLLLGLALLPVPVALSAAVAAKGASAAVAAGTASAAAVKAGLLGQLAQATGAHPVAAAVTAGTLLAGAVVTTVTWPPAGPPAPPAIAAPTSARPPESAATVPPRPAATTAPPAPRQTRPAAATPSATATRPFPLGPASLEPVDAAGLVVTTVNGYGVLAPVTSGSAEAARRLATFQVVPGLADPGCVSFTIGGGWYLRHSSWRLRLHRDDGTRLFRFDATFCVRAGSAPGSVFLESSNYPGRFLRHRGPQLWVDPPDGTAAFRSGASFRRRPPLAG